MARDSIQDMRKLAERSLRHTDEALARRRELTKQFVSEINREIAEARRMLNFLGDPWKRGDHTEYEVMRIALDKALTSRKKDRRAELLREWKDLLRLRERSLELQRENVGLTIGDSHSGGPTGESAAPGGRLERRAMSRPNNTKIHKLAAKTPLLHQRPD